MEPLTLAARNQMAAKFGALVGALYLILFTVVNMLVGNYIVYMLMKLMVYIIYLVIIGVLLSQVKKANGGYLEFREAFGAAFMIILITNIIYYAYSWIYMLYIDPHFMEKIKASTITFMENLKTPEEAIDKTAKQMDEALASSKRFDFGKTVMGFCGFIILDSLFAMLVCLIVRKKRPMFEPQSPSN